MKNIFNYILPAILLLPVVASAQFGDVNRFFDDAMGLINDFLIPLLLAVSFLLFIWGLMQYFFITDDSGDNKKKGRDLMIWGIFAFVIIVSILGIVELIANGLGLSGGDPAKPPSVPRI